MKLEYKGKEPVVLVDQDSLLYLRAVLLSNENVSVILDFERSANTYKLKSFKIPKQATSDSYAIIDESELSNLPKLPGMCVSRKLEAINKKHEKLIEATFNSVKEYVVLAISKNGKATANVFFNNLMFIDVEVVVSKNIPKDIIEKANKDVNSANRSWTYKDGYDPHSPFFYVEEPIILKNKIDWRKLLENGVTQSSFISVCQLTKDDLYAWLVQQFKSHYGKDMVAKDGYIFCKGNSPVCLSAHIDTVFKKPPHEIIVNEKNQISSLQGLGGDDRCGIIGTLYLMGQMDANGQKPSIFLSTDEEKGGSTTKVGSKDCKDLVENVRFIIALDRRGSNDSVYYDCGNEEFKKWIDSFGFVEAKGIKTDICTLCSDWDVTGVNLSVGYYGEHTTSEYVVIEELQATLAKCINIINKADPDKHFKFEKKEYRYTYQHNENSYFDRWCMFFPGDQVFTKTFGCVGYESPNWNSEKVDVKAYSEFRVIEVKNSFCRVVYNGKTIWIPQSSLLLDYQC